MIRGWRNQIHIWQHKTEPDKYIQVVTYKHDGHFYHKEYTKGHDTEVKLTRIRKADLLKLLEHYDWIIDTINIM